MTWGPVLSPGGGGKRARASISPERSLTLCSYSPTRPSEKGPVSIAAGFGMGLGMNGGCSPLDEETGTGTYSVPSCSTHQWLLCMPVLCQYNCVCIRCPGAFTRPV